MALSSDDQTRLSRLQAAYDALISGQAVAKVALAGGRMKEYAKADMTKLKAEIDALRTQAASPTVSSTPRQRGSVRVRVL